MQHRYLCERCGGTGHQEAGCWSGKAYDSKAGTCESCDGAGYLGAKVHTHSNNDAPRWMDRPDRPGTWVCARIKTGEYGEMPDVAINLTQEEIDKGAPFVSKRVYGPIPEDE